MIFKTSSGRKIIRLKVETFPDFFNNIYLIEDEKFFLVDSGSVLDISFESLKKGLDEAKISLRDISCVFITHSHIDHFGGLSNINIKAYAHELDSKTIENFSEMFLYAKKSIRNFLETAGVSDKDIEKLINAYAFGKKLVKSYPVSRKIKDGEEINGVKFIHTPGHSPGHLCIKVDDIILTGDHILPKITPHQFPESIMRYTGLGHYLSSLEKIKKEDVSLALPAHGEEIENLEKRIDEIIKHHQERLEKVLNILKTPKTIVEVSMELFGERKGYDIVLAIEEAGAHVEYLWERGYLSIHNISEIESGKDKAIKFVKR